MNTQPIIRLAFDSKRLFLNSSGLGNYSRDLLYRLAHQYPQHAYHLYSPSTPMRPFNKYFHQDARFHLHSSRSFSKAWWRSFGIKRQLIKDKIQLYHGLSHEIPFGLSHTGIKSLVTIHDLIFKTMPQSYPLSDRLLYDYKCRYACANADHIVAISQHTKNDIIKYYGISASKVSVIYQSCAETFKTKVSSSGIQRVLQSHHLPSEYMLYVGSIIERKNLLLLVEALAMLPRNIKIPLVVIGQGKGSYYKKVKSFIHKYGLASRVFFPKGITNEELPAIYQGAQLFCYVSAYEGFGIPILEALYSKVPVLTSKSSALPEAAGEGAFYVEDISAQAIASQMEVALIDEQRRRVAIEKGNAHTAVFDAEKLTAEMMGLYEGIV